MKNPRRFIQGTLEYMTQCVLFPGIELHFEDVILFYKKNLDDLLKHRRKNIH